ncbi:respirasome Complex Assembly Factor 1 [Leguminivora glycinivorella]|uniref:respirasome Complex Assembly Factor 1 n=1 Tax=Leguminivora glycinivorella TaxID=1035111 RepID=UPI00200CEA10|nr:respirasome Complex Assembly Factor 1 [Leguminivora glycinivorella]
MSVKNKSSDSANKGKVTESVWKKIFEANAEWPDKDEFLDVIYWMRQAIGIILGLCWGLLPLKGFLGLLLFVLVNAAVIYFYVNNFQNIDEEEYGGMWEITKEGFMTSFAGFLVTWIIMYTGLHGSSL